MSERGTRPENELNAVWGVSLIVVHCAHCGAAHLIPEGVQPMRCPSCFQARVEPGAAPARCESPEQVVGYRVTERQLAGILERWSQGVWFRPSDLQPSTLTRRAHRYLVPQWLVDGRVEGAWRADVGFDYQVVSSQDQYRDGTGWRSREVKETRVRWEPRAGRLDRTYENVPAPALDDHRNWMARLGGFDVEQREPYRPESVASATVRVPSLAPEAAWPGVKSAFDRQAEAECRMATGADHIRDFTLDAEYDELNWTQLLLPAYLTWYEEGGEVWPVLINGQSGRLNGVLRASARKARNVSLILGGVGLLLFLLGGVLALLGALLPPVAVVGGVLLVLGVLVALAAPAPALGVWVFNRRSQTIEP